MADKTSRPVVPGLILILLGFLFLLSNFGALNFDWSVLWTWILILTGVIFWVGFFFERDKYGLLMPGTVLLVIGIVFNITARYNWAYMEDLWPFFILAPALGFYAMYFFGRREGGLLVPAGILTIIGLVFLMQSFVVLKYLWPLAMIAAGVLILMRPRGGGGQSGGEGTDGRGDGGGHARGAGHPGGHAHGTGPHSVSPHGHPGESGPYKAPGGGESGEEGSS